jgi:DNA helicase-2/ATP-dependent DNA helicase PcrA
MIAPLKFHITNQPKRADGHVYGGRSRFMTEKVLKCFDAIAFQGSNLAEGTLTDGAQSTFDVGARVKDMW